MASCGMTSGNASLETNFSLTSPVLVRQQILPATPRSRLSHELRRGAPYTSVPSISICSFRNSELGFNLSPGLSVWEPKMVALEGFFLGVTKAHKEDPLRQIK